MKPKMFVLVTVLAALAVSARLAVGQTSNRTDFAYQGRLKVGGGTPDPGARFDLRFRLFDAAAGGNQLDESFVQTVAPDTNGLFTVLVDAHPAWSSSGTAQWVELGARRSSATGSYVTLTPRQRVSPVPTALHAQQADVANTFTGAVSVAQLPTNVNADLLDGLDSAAFARGPVVKSLNGLRDDIQLMAGQNVTLTPNGNTLTVAAAGVAGPPGPIGPQGPAGLMGDKGDPGATGATGPQGPAGAQGVAGPPGPTGPVGSIGLQGPKGDQGQTGASGPIGPVGPIGPAGPQGLIGPTGPVGSPGVAGPQGPQGTEGETGVQGPAGPQGPAGLNWRGAWNVATAYALDDAVSHNGSSWMATTANTGSAPVTGSANWDLLALKGEIGPVGATGPAGAAGVQGPQGPIGPAGSTGATGPAGPQGAVGPQGTPGSADAWSRTGNAGTSPANNFIGTTDSQPLEIKVNGRRALRVQWAGDSTDSGSTDDGTVNLIGGAPINTITAGRVGSVIAGGGAGDYAGNPFFNWIQADYGVISGGNGNIVFSTSDFGTIGGGQQNSTSGDFSTVGGGQRNTASGGSSTIGGGLNNAASNHSSTVGGGSDNEASSDYCTVGGGSDNEASSDYCTVGGGRQNAAGSGSDNEASVYSTVGGGQRNTASGGSSTIGGGANNAASNHSSTVGGGQRNTASGFSSTVGGGLGNEATGLHSTIPGGQENVAGGDCSFAAGRRAKANHAGAFVWADSFGYDFSSTAVNQFRVRATGGVRIYTGVDGNGVPDAGVGLTANDTSWNVISDRAVKKNFAQVDTQAVLEKLAQVPVQQWNYQWEKDGQTPHLGPMSQDFKAAFYPGRDHKTISTLEFDGVALAAIQGLNQKLEQALKAKDTRIEALEKRVEKLEQLVTALTQTGGAQ